MISELSIWCLGNTIWDTFWEALALSLTLHSCNSIVNILLGRKIG